jgi:hypothetical protein
MNSISSSSRAIAFSGKTLILISHASFAPFVLYKPTILFLSGHLYKISQQSHLSRPPPMYRPALAFPLSRLFSLCASLRPCKFALSFPRKDADPYQDLPHIW